jgi:hypothetical protein
MRTSKSSLLRCCSILEEGGWDSIRGQESCAFRGGHRRAPLTPRVKETNLEVAAHIILRSSVRFIEVVVVSDVLWTTFRSQGVNLGAAQHGSNRFSSFFGERSEVFLLEGGVGLIPRDILVVHLRWHICVHLMILAELLEEAGQSLGERGRAPWFHLIYSFAEVEVGVGSFPGRYYVENAEDL